MLLAGCPTVVPATQVLVEIDAEPGLRSAGRALVISVRGGPDEAREARHEETLEAPIEWPVTVAVTPLNGDATRSLEVIAELRDAGGSALAAVRAISGFAPRRTVIARLLLEDCCRDVACGAEETCRRCACGPATLDPDDLPDYTADAGAADAGAVDATVDGGRCPSVACPAAEPVCDGGECVACTAADAGACRAGERCDPVARQCVRACDVDDDCDPGRICTAGACVEGCRDDRPCLGAATCCDDACVDLDADPRHCGGCGMACGAGEDCCDRVCADTTSDVARCGACDTACGTANGVASCDDGTCSIACDASHDDCDGANANGCETDLRTTTDCGTCGTPCAVDHGAGTCASGTCAIASCDAGFLDCRGGVPDGCETEVAIDPDDCGACGNDCDAPSAVTACVSGSCAVVSCTTDFGDCDGSAASGCETPLSGNVAHCHACGRSCALRGTVRECGATDCVTLGCMAGYTDCNGGTDGCEAFLANDNRNCGSCGNTCAFGTSCSSGHCCPGSSGWCGSGCVDLSSDPGNCGTCGRVCPSGTCFDYDCI